MSTRTIALDDPLADYLQSQSLREPPAFRRCRQETAQLPMCNMQIAPEQGQFLYLQLRLMGARRAIEIGTFTGYSALWIASALPPDGCLIACDINEEWTSRARHYWEDAGVKDRIELRLGRGRDTMDTLLKNDQQQSFDFVFIDADKEQYDAYYERALQLIRPGGLIAIDNVLWGGKVANSNATDPDTQAIRAFNEKLHNDERVDLSLIPIGDGLTLCRKRLSESSRS